MIESERCKIGQWPTWCEGCQKFHVAEPERWWGAFYSYEEHTLPIELVADSLWRSVGNKERKGYKLRFISERFMWGRRTLLAHMEKVS